MEHSHCEWCRQGTYILFTSESLEYHVDILLRNYFVCLESLIVFNMILYLVTLVERVYKGQRRVTMATWQRWATSLDIYPNLTASLSARRPHQRLQSPMYGNVKNLVTNEV